MRVKTISSFFFSLREVRVKRLAAGLITNLHIDILKCETYDTRSI